MIRLRSIECLLTGHDDIIKGRGGRMFVSCIKCGRDSNGIPTGGLEFAPSRTQRAAEVAQHFKPRRTR
jgi:hypothetical protein